MSYPGGGIPITPNSAPTPASRAPLSANTKGKGRAIPSPLGPGTGTGTGTAAPTGNIGSSSNGAARQNDRRWIGGVQVETRCVISLLMNWLLMIRTGIAEWTLLTNLLPLLWCVLYSLSALLHLMMNRVETCFLSTPNSFKSSIPEGQVNPDKYYGTSL